MNKTEELKEKVHIIANKHHNMALLDGGFQHQLDAEQAYFDLIKQSNREAYLQGIKDFQIATSLPISDYGNADYVLRMQDIKAKEFLFSLEKGTNNE